MCRYVRMYAYICIDVCIWVGRLGGEWVGNFFEEIGTHIYTFLYVDALMWQCLTYCHFYVCWCQNMGISTYLDATMYQDVFMSRCHDAIAIGCHQYMLICRYVRRHRHTYVDMWMRYYAMVIIRYGYIYICWFVVMSMSINSGRILLWPYLNILTRT